MDRFVFHTVPSETMFLSSLKREKSFVMEYTRMEYKIKLEIKITG